MIIKNTMKLKNSLLSFDQDRTNRLYSYQWDRFRVIRPDEDRVTFLNRTGWNESDLADKLVFDAGGGMGRYSRIAGEMGARVIGLDLSWSVSAALEMTVEKSSVAFLRGDLLRTPFADGTFDAIYSIGVIDHTPDPKRAFLELARLLKPGGRISIWVYRKERPILEAVMNAQRAVSTRVPHSLLVFMSRLTAPLGGLKRRLSLHQNRRIARLGVALNVLTIGVSMHPDPESRVCDTLDWYAPKYASRHTAEEVSAWFVEAGLIDVQDLNRPISFHHQGQGNGVNLTGRKPAAGE
ncbi:MAG: class I SAM-dependent methyltransferase [Isosphaeraceae bacterium]